MYFFYDCASDAALAIGDIEVISVVAVLNLARLTWTDDNKLLFCNIRMLKYRLS